MKRLLGVEIEGEPFELPDKVFARFLQWAATADGEELVKVLQVLTTQGASIVQGRSRCGGKRSRARIEPMIMGEVRGAGARDHTGGAPTNKVAHELVTNLAFNWLYATGEMPKAGRSDLSGFGDLVHSVFQWGEISKDPTEAAGYALRRYWTEMKRAKAVPPLQDFLERHRECFDCKWSEDRFAVDGIIFSCGRLNVARSDARKLGATCVPGGALFEFLPFSERWRRNQGSGRGS